MNRRKKLIEVALPLDAINKASAPEKSIRHGHPSTLHIWWARRPLAAWRAGFRRGEVVSTRAFGSARAGPAEVPVYGLRPIGPSRLRPTAASRATLQGRVSRAAWLRLLAS
jgi:hypothetical protein